MEEFDRRYKKLNAAQKQAVDLIEGPGIVIAGPGTGKTELLSVRVANILKQTDASAESILCLTYTDSGVAAIRERLIGIIGKEAYKIAIHTFHSFGSEVISQNSDFFYHGADFNHADELKKNELITQILSKLNPRDILASKFNGKFTYQKDIANTISHIKRNGLTSSELLAVLDQNDLLIEKVNQIFSDLLQQRISKKTIEPLSGLLDQLHGINDRPQLPGVPPLSEIFVSALESALNEAQITNKTTTITAWKNQWFEHDANNKMVLKSTKRQLKLRSLANIYEQYISSMESSELYDFDDMILEVVHALEIYDDLRYNLQEKYQYIMVDEFQDTNLAQMRILRSLTNNPVQADNPNIVVVGDDDQAIYSFQGAEVSNILAFTNLYPSAEVITLVDNYRSSENILNGAREVIVQGVGRLENSLESVNKRLSANAKYPKDCVKIHKATDINSERNWIVKNIKKRIDNGANPEKIAVLVRHHNEVQPLLAYFEREKIPVNYERQDNVLEVDSIKIIEELARLLIFISQSSYDQVNGMLPKLLSHPMWQISPETLWQVGLDAYHNHKLWLEVLDNYPELLKIKKWFIETAAQIINMPMEQAIDLIIGNPQSTQNQDFLSPIYNYFFSPDELDKNPEQYLTHLDALSTLRAKLRDYQISKEPDLNDFINFIKLNRDNNIKISSHRKTIAADKAVNIMTAHKSKGLEFDTVYVTNAIDSVWGISARSISDKISFPENLTIAPAGETDDEKLRLFYVAITRARYELFVSYSELNDNNKNTLGVSFLSESSWEKETITEKPSIETATELAETAWYQPIIQPNNHDLKKLLKPSLENYQLSPTHLNAFIDLVNGGPKKFLLEQLLHFPSAKTPESCYGTAVHKTLQQAHNHITATGRRQPSEDILGNFETNLKAQYLNSDDFQKFLQKGIESLGIFLNANYDSFNQSQKTELDFARQGVIINQAKITGKLDLVDIDTKAKTVAVTDYKTGKPSSHWDNSDIKLHKYRQQLLFYKLLIERSRDYHTLNVTSCKMQFVEPDINNQIWSLDIDFNDLEISNLEKLIQAVWTHIINLDIPDIDKYGKTIKGVRQFEQDLIDGIV